MEERNFFEKTILDMVAGYTKKQTKEMAKIDRAVIENDKAVEKRAAQRYVMLETKLYSLREVARAHNISEGKINIAKLKGISLVLGVDTEKLDIFEERT